MDDGVASGTVMTGTAETTADRAHTSVDLTLVAKRIRRLHDRVCGHGQRVEVTRAGCDDVCVLISKRELEAMEAALAYYASHEAHADTCRGLTKLLVEAGMVHIPAGGHQTFADELAGA